MEFEISPLSENGILEIAEIERQCFSDPWSEEGIREELQNPNAVIFTCSLSGRIAGYAGFYHILDEGYILNVAVHPSYRRKGVGDALIAAVAGEGARRNLSFLTLEVRSGNKQAISLYKKHGFLPCGIRRGFYQNPTEDAVLMTLHLLEQAQS